jgi:hypothetical protein
MSDSRACHKRGVWFDNTPGGTVTTCFLGMQRMANGKRGDSPLSDMLIHGLHPFPADLESMLREVLAIQPQFPDGRRPYVEQIEWLKRFDAWARGEAHDEGRAALSRVLAELRSGQ